MDRRDFLAAWIQALLLAIFPFLRERPLVQSRAIAEAYVERMTVSEWGWWVYDAKWYLVRGYDMRWQIRQHTEVLDELLRHTAYMTSPLRLEEDARGVAIER